MLLEFNVNNFKSIKDSITFSMLASSKDTNNSFNIRKYELLNSSIVYGANASGKSNLLKAMNFMGKIVLNRTKVIQSTDKLPYDPFRLNSETEDASSTFEMVFFINEIKYRYGFEIDNENVYAEWLYADEKGKESKLFYRDTDEDDYVNPNKFSEGNQFFNKKNSLINISKNQLFIWKCDQDGGSIAKSILQWFDRFNFIDGMDHKNYINYTMRQMKDAEFKDKIISLVKTADIGIEDIELEEEEVPDSILESMPISDALKNEIINEGGLTSISLNTFHKKYNAENEEIGTAIFELENEESKGTRKFFAMSAPILDTLRKGKILIIDELDASLHPILTRHLIKLFHNKNVNKLNAQLIFATHDTNLLKKSMFRRDQVWFVEKDKYGASSSYSLAQYKNVRKQEDFEKQYIEGKYGAIPYLSPFDFQD
jgi:AAA15 family ATPase/GTPase